MKAKKLVILQTQFYPSKIMKNFLISASVLLFGQAAFAQTCKPSDSTLMGSGSGNDVFYSLKKGVSTGNGTVKTVANNNWHLAFSVMPSAFPANPANGVAIRVNSQLGESAQSGTTGWRLIKLPGKNWSNWHKLDTTGMYAIPELLDSDSTWNLSAFTKGYTTADPFNFIWGSYNSTTHNVVGNSVFVLYNKTQNTYKKIFINQIVVDTLWQFTIANINNTDSNFVQIGKKSYPNKNFVYYDVVNKVIRDREPDNRTWDLVWTKYKGMLQLGPNKIPFPVTGVLHNNGVKTAQNNGKKCNEVWLANKTAKASDNISTIGFDWKSFNGASYDIADTMVYFISAKDTNTYKMTMVSYAGGPLSKTVFSFYKSTLSIDDNKILGGLEVYPNPATGSITVKTDDVVEMVQVYDVFGKNVASANGATVNVSELSSGVYMSIIKTDKGLFQQKFIKQ